MAAVTLFCMPFVHIQDENGVPVVGAKISAFETGSSTPAVLFHTSAPGTPWTQPIVTNAAGNTSGPVYVAPTPALKIVVVDANNVPVTGYPVDPWFPPAVATA